MTVSTTNNKHIYEGNGIAVQWPYSFPLLSASHVKVYLTNGAGAVSEITSDFWVNTAEGYVKYPGYEPGTEPPLVDQPPVLPAGWKITLLREVPLTQEIDLVKSGSYMPEVLEGGYDRATMQIQQLAENIGRSVQLPVDAPAGAGDELLSMILNSAARAVSSAGSAAVSAGSAQSSQQSAASSAGAAQSDAAAANLSASIAQSSVAGLGSDSITSAPVTGEKTITATAASLFAGSSRLANRSKVTVRNDDQAIRIRVGPSGVTQQSGFPVEPGGFAEFLINRAQAVDIFAISEGAAVVAEVWES